MMKIKELARIAYEINIALLKSYGDRSQPPWEIAPQWLKDSAISGVKFHLANPDASPSYSHELWVKELTADGWVYGPIQVNSIKVHPLLIPFDEIQQAIAQVLGPIFDPGFSGPSCGFRPGRSGHDGIRQVRQFIRQGRKVAVDLDLAKFFDRVDYDVLMSRVARRIKDKRVLRLIGKYLRAGVMVKDRLQATAMGVPQGGPLSPLLANILLDDLDKELERRGHSFSRYADDLIILVRVQRA